MQLSEQYRPRTWDEVVGQEKAIRTIQTACKSGYGGEALWLSGGSGTGKTTIARLIGGEVAGALATTECNAKDVDMGFVRDMECHWNTTVLPTPGSTRTGRAWVFNEAHNFRASVCELLLTVLEEIPSHVVIVCTTTIDAEKGLFEDYIGAKAFTSRFIKVKLSRVGLCKPFAAYARQAALAEGLDGAPIEDYERCVADRGNNLRDVMKFIQGGGMMP